MTELAEHAARLADPATGLRERKKDDTRKALIEASYRLTLERGFHHFTVAEVAEQVGVSRRTFSNYFTSKAECVVAMNESRSELILHDLASAASDEPLDQLVLRLLHAVAAEVTDEWADFLSILFTEPELRKECSRVDEQLASVVASGIAARLGIEAYDVAAQAIATFSIVSSRAAFERWLLDGRPGGSAGLIRLLERIFRLLDLGALEALASSTAEQS